VTPRDVSLPPAPPQRSALILSTAAAIGGMERVCCTLAVELREFGWNTKLVFAAEHATDELLAWAREQGADVVASPALADASGAHDLKTLLALRRLIREYDPDVVNIHYGDNFISLKDILAARLAGLRRRLVVSVHHPSPWAGQRRKRILTSVAARLASKVTVFSTATGEILREARVPARSIRLIPCGVPVPQAAVGAPPTGSAPLSASTPLVVGSLSRLVPYKRIDVLIEAMADPRLAGCRLVIAGEGLDRPRLERLAAELLPGRHEFRGRVPDVYDFLRTCDVFALPSELEGFGLVFVEAAMVGVPSVAVRCGGVPDAVLDGSTGILVDQPDVAAVAEALVRLVHDDELRRQMGERAQQRALTDLSDVRMAARFDALLAG
jgi:glycosyltransferase involved in cell wall biosynthesis